MINWFCKHKYRIIDRLPCTFKYEDGTVSNCAITLLECDKCGHRKVLSRDKFYYNEELWDLIQIWKKGQIEWEEQGFMKQEKIDKICLN